MVYLCVFSCGVYLYFSIVMYVKRHKQFEIGCGSILNKMYYYYLFILCVEMLLGVKMLRIHPSFVNTVL